MLNILNPATGEVIDRVQENSPQSMTDIFSRLKSYRVRSTINERIAGINNFVAALEKNRHDLAQLLTKEVGKPIKQAHGEIKDTINRTEFFVKNIEQVAKTREVFSDDNLREQIRFEPLGLILCISAWNYPYFVSTNVILPALLAGCRVVFKPSELATLSGQKMAELICQQDCFKESFAVVVGGKDVGAYLVKQDYDGIFFTGSEQAGLKIKEAVGSRMIRTQFELGGKDAAYLAPDCDIDKSVDSIIDGAFFNCGQSCCSIERAYIHQSIATDVKAKLESALKKIKMGSPMDGDTYLGPLTRKEQADFLSAQVEDARHKGARIVGGGKKVDGPGHFFEPTLIFDANDQMTVMTEESFGPILAVEEVGSDEEAIAKINQSRFGLTASVYSNDEKRATAILSQLEVGTAYWNCCDKVSPRLPWGGRKNSGLGVTLSTLGLEMYLRPKAWFLKSQV